MFRVCVFVRWGEGKERLRVNGLFVEIWIVISLLEEGKKYEEETGIRISRQETTRSNNTMLLYQLSLLYIYIYLHAVCS